MQQMQPNRRLQIKKSDRHFPHHRGREEAVHKHGRRDGEIEREQDI